MPTKARYEIVSAFHATHLESTRDTARFLGIWDDTLRSALKWAEHTMDREGRPRVLEKEHKYYIERRVN